MGSPATLPAMSQRATSTAPIARYVVSRFLCHIAWYRRSRSSGSSLSTTGFRYWMSDCPSRCAPRIEEPRKACPLTPSSVSMVTRPSWLLPLNFPVCRPYVVAGISSQPNSVRWTSVIFMAGGDYHIRVTTRGRRHQRRRGELVGLLGHAEAKVRVAGIDHHAFYGGARPSSPENHLT